MTKISFKTFFQSCEKADIVDCFELKCEIGKLDPNQNYAQITFEARLWESTLLSVSTFRCKNDLCKNL